MSKLKLTFACGDYDFLRPLFDGTVTVPGIDQNVLTMPSPERHGRMLRHEEFDVCELSLVGYLVARDRGCNYTAIPVFPHRRFIRSGCLPSETAHRKWRCFFQTRRQPRSTTIKRAAFSRSCTRWWSRITFWRKIPGWR